MCVCVCVCVCVRSCMWCFKAEFVYNVLFILYSSVCGFFSLGFGKLPFRPKFPVHVNPFRSLSRVLKLPLHVKHRRSLGPDPTGTGTMALDPTFGSFTLLEPVTHLVNVFRLFRLKRIVLVFTVWTQ